jgi:UDP-MurNAc hydroxylase
MRATSIGHAGILVETAAGTIVCDPWFIPAFFGSWFVFPRNDQLSDDLLARIERADFLYVSHLHADHLDEAWLREHLRRDITVLLPDFPTDELERTLRALGFRAFVSTTNAARLEIAPGLDVTIHVETSISDGPQGDSAIVIEHGGHRLLNQNDCRPHDPGVFVLDGPIHLHFLQYSGAIWYPMVYDEPEGRKRQLAASKIEAQFARALQYVDAIKATAIVPSAGPPCFLDPDLASMNMVTGEELSIFPDQTAFLRRLVAMGNHHGHLTVPGTEFTVDTTTAATVVSARQPVDEPVLSRPFTDKAAYLAEYAADWSPWLTDHKANWVQPQADLIGRLQAWWNPLLEIAPTLSRSVGAAALLRLVHPEQPLDVLIDFPNQQVRLYDDEAFSFRFTIARELVETVTARRAVDWSNALFLSCRFSAWREGPFNEYLYNFFKSLSPERMRRAEAEAAAKRAATGAVEEVTIGAYRVERFCPHRMADLSRFGALDGDTLTCTLHGWSFDLADGGRCLTSDDHRPLRVRRVTGER